MQHIKPSLCHDTELSKRGFEEELAVAAFTFFLQGFQMSSLKITAGRFSSQNPANQSAGSISLTMLAKQRCEYFCKQAHTQVSLMHVAFSFEFWVQRSLSALKNSLKMAFFSYTWRESDLLIQ